MGQQDLDQGAGACSITEIASAASRYHWCPAGNAPLRHKQRAPEALGTDEASPGTGSCIAPKVTGPCGCAGSRACRGQVEETSAPRRSQHRAGVRALGSAGPLSTWRGTWDRRGADVLEGDALRQPHRSQGTANDPVRMNVHAPSPTTRQSSTPSASRNCRAVIGSLMRST